MRVDTIFLKVSVLSVTVNKSRRDSGLSLVRSKMKVIKNNVHSSPLDYAKEIHIFWTFCLARRFLLFVMSMATIFPVGKFFKKNPKAKEFTFKGFEPTLKAIFKNI